MSDDFTCLALVLSVVGTAWVTVRFCADACLRGGRSFWIKAVFLAEQRAAYREFSKQVDGMKEVANEDA
jgi:hypothetical protein